MNLLHQPVWVFDIDHRRVHWANDAALKVWRADSLEALCARDLGQDMSPSVALRLAQYQRDFVENGASFNEQWTLYPGGVAVPMQVVFSGYRLPDGRMAMLCEARTAVEASPESLRSVDALLHTAVLITLFDLNGCPLYRNPAARASARVLEQTLQDRIADPQACIDFFKDLWGAGSAHGTLLMRTCQGERWHELSARRCQDPATGAAAFVVSEVDVSRLKQTEAKANFLALHDALTGLPNRAHVMERFAEAIDEIRRQGSEAALMFIDLDHFKNVNDTLGHDSGDLLLIEVAKRLRKVTRGADLVARLGGDEFLILIAARQIRPEVSRLRSRIVKTISQPVLLGAREVRVTASLGVSLYPQDGDDLESLLRKADMAMYTAKDRGRNELAYFEQSMATAIEARTELEDDLKRALGRAEFELHYQPRVSVASGRVVGAEALVRWRHPRRGLLGPDAFIPLCESTGLIHLLGVVVFREALQQRADWARLGHELRISVNLSPRQLSLASLPEELAKVLSSLGCAPQGVELEITESLLMGSDPAAVEALRRIHTLGLSIALDDFGTGFSNLAYLQRFPISTLKIDKTFIQGLAADRPLAEMIVAMSRLMRLKVVAEGVETAEQLAWIREQGIEEFQGYLFSRPLPATEFQALLEASMEAESRAERVSLVAGCYSRDGSRGLYGLDYDPVQGRFGEPRLLAEADNPSWLTLAGQRVYVANELEQGRLSAYEVSSKGRLSLLGSSDTLGAAPCHVALSPDGRFAATANYMGGSMSVFVLGQDGAPQPGPQVLTHLGRGPDAARQEAPHVHWVQWSPEGERLYCVDLGLDEVKAYPFDSRTGRASAGFTALQLQPGDGPRHLLFHPALATAYVLNELSNTLVVVDRGLDGTLTERSRHSTLPLDFQGHSQAGHLQLSANGKALYASNRGHNSIAVFAVAADGGVSLLQIEPSLGDWPRHFLLLEASRTLLVANQESRNIVAFKMEIDGRLTVAGGQAALAQVTFLGSLAPPREHALLGFQAAQSTAS